ncbi:MAG: hypothetical protein IJF42_05955 [Clostridia bacterium]|nr:hypothetical protein [Clostridia bacterium]
MAKRMRWGCACVVLAMLLAGCATAVQDSGQSSSTTTTASTTVTTTTTATTTTATTTTTDTSDITTVTVTEATSSVTTTATTKATTKKPATSTTKKKATTTTKPTTTTTTKPTQVKYEVPDTEAIAREILKLINEERKALGRCELNTAPIAHEIATVRANELQIEYDHYRPDGTTSGTIFTEYKYGEQNGQIGLPDGNGGWILVPAYSPGGRENTAWQAWFDTVTNDPEILARSVVYGETDPKVAEHYSELSGTGFKGSKNHWDDITNETYTGIGIGVSIKEPEPGGFAYSFTVSILTMKKTYG